MRFTKVLPKPAMIVAVVALIAALSGSAYAVSKIDGSEIRDNSVTGEQVKERSLERVPTAGKAKEAGRAKDADTVGGERPDDLKVRWLLLNEQGAIEDQSGGFTILDAYDTNANAYVDAGESLVGKGLTATVAIQNQIDTDPVAAGVQGSRNGEAAVTRCQIPGVVECAPANAKTVNALVVTASNPDGSPAATPSPGAGSGTSTKRIYVEITE